MGRVYCSHIVFGAKEQRRARQTDYTKSRRKEEVPRTWVSGRTDSTLLPYHSELASAVFAFHLPFLFQPGPETNQTRAQTSSAAGRNRASTPRTLKEQENSFQSTLTSCALLCQEYLLRNIHFVTSLADCDSCDFSYNVEKKSIHFF